VAQVFGKSHDRETAIAATQINLRRAEPHKVSGFGIVDGMPDGPSAEGRMLRADGYLVLIPKQTALVFEPPMTADTAFKTNVWMGFQGSQRADGVVVASKASFRENSVSKSEGKLREKTEHDPSAVDPRAKQSTLSKAFRGIDPKQIPSYKDAQMQARVSEIGEKLVPRYQRELAESDETKINFRFQVVEDKSLKDSVALPNGIILIPHGTVERLQNDSQLAAVLADGIADALEKQSFRLGHETKKLRLAEAGTAFMSGVGMATGLFGAATEENMKRHAVEQSCRVSLFLMHDAGYEVKEAPRAWWLLAEGYEVTPMPAVVLYLYRTLGETWHRE
jgi:hypothetical protein